MPDPRDDQIARWLQEGLELYGNGEEAEAIVVWKQILELDPANGDARDYIQTASRSLVNEAARRIESSVEVVIEEARRLMGAGDFEGALELLRSSSGDSSSYIELEALIELVRVRLMRSYRERVGDLDAIPVLTADDQALTRFNLPPNAGFLMSLLDGSTTVNDLITLSGMDSFDALRTVGGLMEAGIVELRG